MSPAPDGSVRSRSFMTRNDPSFRALSCFRSEMLAGCRTLDFRPALYWWAEFLRRRAESRLSHG